MDNKQTFARHPQVMAAVVDIMATAMEVNKEDGLNVWVTFSGHVDWLEVRAAVGDFRNTVKVPEGDQISMSFYGWGKDGEEEFETAKAEALQKLLTRLKAVQDCIICLGARYGSLTQAQIKKLQKSELAAKEIEQMDESIKAVTDKLAAMKAERKRKAGSL